MVSPSLIQALANTLLIASTATVIAMTFAIVIVWSTREFFGGTLNNKCMLVNAEMSKLGYAIPGTILAIGLLLPYRWVDVELSTFLSSVTNRQNNLLMLGSIAGVAFACAIRFVAIGIGNIDAGFARIPLTLDYVARSLGSSSNGVLFKIQLPLIKPAIFASALLIFVECMKELPITLMLRPLNTETLATLLYADASRGHYEQSAFAALMIVLAGMLPVILLTRIHHSGKIFMTDQLSIDRLTLSYTNQSQPMIHQLSLVLESGEIGCLLGPSGCGKSTLLRTIGGFHPVAQGSVTLNGRLLASRTVNTPPEKRRIGLMFQDFALFPHLTVEKNISFGLNKLDMTQRKIRVAEMLELVNMKNFSQSYPHELSGGQQQRVALARALAPEPELLLLDEPFSNLDEQTTKELITEMKPIIRRTGCKALIVTHNIEQAQTLSDRMGFIASGELSSWSPIPKDPYQARAACA